MSVASGRNGPCLAIWGAGLIAIALVAAGCAEERRFARQGGTKETKALVVPARITPPVTVARIEGAPATWQLNARVAKALRDRDVPAGTEARGKASYLLNGRAERIAPAEGSAAPRLRIAWTLQDAQGKAVGSAVQVAVHPVAADARLDANIDRKVDPVALDRLARIAAEHLTPLVPHTQVRSDARPDVRQAGRADDPIWRRVATAPERPNSGASVTALGKQDARNAENGLAARFLKLRSVTTIASRSPEERIAEKRRAAQPKPPEQRAAAPVIKPAAAEGTALTRRSVVTERIAYEAKPGAAATAARPNIAKVVPAAATGGRAHRSEVLRKDDAIRPAPDARKFPAAAGATTATRKAVQLAEAAGGRDDDAAQGFWVQLASNPSPQASRAAWQALVARHAELLERQPHAINRADLGRKGVYYRLQLGPYPNVAQAKRICTSLRAAQVPCLLMAARGQVATRTPSARRAAPKPPEAVTTPPKVQSRKVEPKKAEPAKTRVEPKPERGAAAKAGTDKSAGAKSAAGTASAIRPAAGTEKPAPQAKAGTAKGADEAANGGAKPGFGARTEKPKSRADSLPFQRSRALPGLPD